MLGVQDIRFAVYSVCMVTIKKIAIKSGIHQIKQAKVPEINYFMQQRSSRTV